MIHKAMDVKLVVKPLMGILVHTHFWEGPCRAGIRENMEPEAEMRIAREKFDNCKKQIQDLNPECEVLEPVFVPYYQSFVLDEKVQEEIRKDLDRADCIIVLNQRIPKIERFDKPVISFTHAVSAADTCAYLRSIGREGYYAIDRKELDDVLHMLWVRKAMKNTRALILTAGEVPTWGLLSNIKDLEHLRSQYGVEIVKKPFTEVFQFMDRVDISEAQRICDELYADSQESKVNIEYRVQDIVYYLAVKAMLEFYQCNAFSTACVELCISQVPQKRKFVPCITHSLLKDEGIPSGCEEDLNALLAMILMMYTAMRPAFMGNPLFETDEIVSLHHSVPCLRMNGFETEKLKYSIYAFTGQGFGGKIQVDFAQNLSKKVTICRFDPTGTKMLMKVGEVIESKYTDYYCSPYYFVMVDDARKYLHSIMDFGHHQVLIFGDFSNQLKKMANLYQITVVEG